MVYLDDLKALRDKGVHRIGVPSIPVRVQRANHSPTRSSATATTVIAKL